MEGRAGQVTVEAPDPGRSRGLRTRGHRVKVAGLWSLGRLAVVGHDPASRLPKPAANRRGRQGHVVER